MRHIGRVVAHSAIILFVVLLLSLAALTVMTGSSDGWLTALLNGPIDAVVGERAGIYFHTQRLHAAWQGGCPVLVELTGAEVTLQNGPADHLAIETVRLCGSQVTLHNVVAGAPQHKRLLTMWEVRANLFTHSAFVEKLAVADRAGRVLVEIDKGELANASLTASGMVVLQDPNSGEPVARAGQVQTSSFHLPVQANGELNLARLSTTSLQLRVDQARPTPRDIAALQATGQELAGFAQQAVLSGGKLLTVIHDLALFALLAATVFVTILKWFASPGMHPLLVRVLISFVPALVAYLLFFLFRSVSTAAGLIVAAVALGIVAAITLWQILYRRSQDWLSRWEPFALDAFAPAPLVLLLLLWALELRLPARNIPGSILVSSVELKALNARLESNGFTSEITVPAARLASLKLILQPGKLGLDTAMLDRFELNGGDARVQDEAGQELARSQIQSLAAAGINVGKEISTGAVRPFEVKNLELHAGVESGILARHVRQFQWMPAEWHAPQRLQIAVSGSLSRREHLQFTASAEVRSRVLDFNAMAAGDSESIEIGNLHTLKDSPLKIGSATGTITWRTGLKTLLTMREMGGPGFGIESGNVDASLHMPEFTLKSRWQGANVSFSGYQTSLDSSAFDAAFTEHTFSTSAHTSGVTVKSTKNGEQNSWLQADFPNVEAHASGTRTGWNSIAGTASFRVADGEQSVLSADRALRFSADPARGTITVPEQTLELQQGMTTVIPQRFGLTLSLAGDLQSINLRTRIPEMILPDVAPLQISTGDLQLSGRWRSGNPSELRFSSGWNRLDLPAMAGDWTLKNIAKLRLETDGTATGALFKQLDALRERAGGFHFERERSFRIEGNIERGANSLIVQGRQGSGARISPVVDTHLLCIRRGRIAESDIHAAASGIRTLDGHGNLSAAADWKAVGNSSSLAVRVPRSDGAGLLDVTLLRQPGSLRFSLDKQLPLARFMPEIQPFLSQAGINLSDFEIGATLLQLEGQADFAGSEWTRLVARTETAPGPLFRFTENTSPAHPLDLSVGSSGDARGLRVNLTGEDGAVRVTAEAPGLAVRSDGGAEHANIDANVTASLSHSTSASPLLSRIRTTVAGVRAGVEGARRAFPVNSEEQPTLAWKLKLSDDVLEEPALSVGLDRLKLRLRAEPSFVSLDRSTRLDFSSTVAADLSLQEDQLILDALLQARYDLRLKDLGLHRADVTLPLLIAFGDALQPVNAPHGPLWDSQRYLAFWDGYRPVNATAASKDPWQWTQVALGPIEIEELSVAPPLRASIKLSKDVVQMDVPVKGSFLYGESAGTLQSQIRWAENEAVLDSFLVWSLQQAQAEALHIATGFGYQPLVQDRMGLSLGMSARGLTLSRRVLEAALADPGSFNQFDKLALDLDVGSVPGSTGSLQFESDFDVKRMNDLLRQITNDIQLTFPPEAISWESAKLKLLLKDGALDNSVPIVALTAVQGVRNDLAQFSGSLRLFAGRERSTPVQDIVHTLMLFNERLQ